MKHWRVKGKKRSSMISVMTVMTITLSVSGIAMTKSIIVVGSGAFGLSSALHLVQSGYKDITVFDRLNLADLRFSFENGADTASADINKVFRAFYADREHYHRLALKAKIHFDQWDEEVRSLSDEEAVKLGYISKKIIDNTGLIRLDNTPQLTNDEIFNLKSFKESGLRGTQFDINDPEDIKRAKQTGWFEKFDAYGLKKSGSLGHITGVLDSTSGLIYASNALTYVYNLLVNQGVKFIAGDPDGVLSEFIGEDEVKGIITKDGKKHYADLTIIATGPWTASYLPELAGLSEAHTGNVILIKIPDDRKDLQKKYANIPILNWRVGEEKEREKFSGFGVFPITDGYVKIITRQRKYSNPIKLKDGTVVSQPLTIRSNPPETRLSKELITVVKDFIRVFLPDLVEFGITKTQLLWYTDTINNDFIVDYAPSRKNLLVVTGGSGHGFKFTPVLGQFVVDVIESRENEYTKLFKWRDSKNYKDINKITGIKNGEDSYYKQELATTEDLKFTKEDLNRVIDI